MESKTQGQRNPRTLQFLAVAACTLNPIKNIRITTYSFQEGIVANSNGKLAIQVRNKTSLKKTVLSFIDGDYPKYTREYVTNKTLEPPAMSRASGNQPRGIKGPPRALET